MKRLSFEWVKNEEGKSNLEITNKIKNKQIDDLNNMLIELKKRLEKETFNTKVTYSLISDCSGIYKAIQSNKYKDIITDKYIVSHRMKIIIEKQGRKTTWDDLYTVINSIKPARYSFI